MSLHSSNTNDEEGTDEDAPSRGQQPDWLRQIQNWSWEPELLTSGGSLVTLYFVINKIWYFEGWIMFHFEVTPFLASITSSVVLTLLIILFLTFLVHIGIRIAWIAFVGLSYVYPDGGDKKEAGHIGIVHDSLGFQHPSRVVLKLENIGSRLFSIPIMIFSMVAFLIIGFLLPTSIVYYFFGFQAAGIFFLAYLIFTLIIEQSSLKKKEWVKRFGEIRSVYTLFFLLENIFFTTTARPNRSKWTRFLPILLFVVALFGTFGIIGGEKWSTHDNLFIPPEEVKDEGMGYRANNEYDDSRSPNAYVQRSGLPSFHIEKPYLRSFIAYYEFDDRSRITLASQDSSKEKPEPSELYELKVDSQKVRNAKWSWTHHDETGQLGVEALIPLKRMEKGYHRLKISKKSWDHGRDSVVHYQDWDVVPFWKGSG